MLMAWIFFPIELAFEHLFKYSFDVLQSSILIVVTMWLWHPKLYFLDRFTSARIRPQYWCRFSGTNLAAYRKDLLRIELLLLHSINHSLSSRSVTSYIRCSLTVTQLMDKILETTGTLSLLISIFYFVGDCCF